MPEYEIQTLVAASPERVWDTLSNVAEWPSWLPTVSSVEALNDGEPRVGAEYRVVQPRSRPAVWTITDWKPAENFTWVSSSPGVRVSADHRVSQVEAGRAQVTLRMRFSGPMAWLANLVFGRLTRDYMRQEAESLRFIVERD